MIRRQMFTAGAMPLADPGEVIFQSAGASNSQTVFSWVVPVGVYEVCMLAISSHRAYATRISRGGTDVLNTTWAVGTNGVGGGDGGDAGAQTGPYWGGGGSGGYSGAGGRGGRSESNGFGGYDYYAGTAGAGGGGGGGHSSGTGRGGGVGIYGQGSNGAAGVYGSANGKPGSDTGLLRAGAGTTFNEAGAAGAGNGAQPGGNLRYRNAVSVSPGETLTITLDYWIRDNSVGTGAIVRILWGGARAFPSNAPATTPVGQIVFTGANTTWTIPAGVTTLSMCAQQRDGNQGAVYADLGGTTLLRAQNEARIGDGGGNGGFSSGGGGGAGGYEGNGGDGGGSSTPVNGEWTGLSGGAGQGGGGDGGGGSSRYKGGASWGGGSTNYIDYPAAPGGNTGLSGRNASGTYTDPIEGDSGGGAPTVRGGALAWRNNVAVTPGQVISIYAAGGRIRFIWGPNRSYPNNALKVT
ncbi:hypothetical protein [Paracidovorax cattleyae]|uniref:hypothetical protein n=1 Tax=Paracidovorax cattleyae TaxID=80868 RepID=UPI0018AFD72F|nr:hypothetical protein [Paracidovorax cattleyae]MBF9263942.1 hypothetical protein [Paracidovorax cattleyae]